MSGLGGIAVVSTLNAFDKELEVYMLPYRLRLIRTTRGDNGFSGVRTLTSQVQFMKDLAKEAEMNKEAGDSMPAEEEEVGENEAKSADGHPGVFGEINEGEYMTVSPGQSLKYLVCNPQHRWALQINTDGIALLMPVSKKKAKSAFKGWAVIEVNGIASFV